MGNDYTVDELNDQLKHTNELLKDAEKRFESLLKIVTNMNKTATKSTGTYGSSSTDKVFKQAEKKTHEFNKQMDKMLDVRQQLIDSEYDRLDKNRREGQEKTRQFILMRRETKMMEESGKTKRKEMSLQAKRIDMMGRLAGGAQGGLAGFIGMGFGQVLSRGSE
jgi:cysteinyl-tRNA synthetase